jgi:hypothetical protein
VETIFQALVIWINAWDKYCGQNIQPPFNRLQYTK